MGAISERVTGLDEPFSAAVTVAVWSEASAPVLAVKVAEVALAATLTEEGTVKTDGALLVSVTTVLLVTDFDRVTVQVVLALEARVVAAHCRVESDRQGLSESVTDWDEPFSEAVMVAVWSAGNAPVLAVNVAEVALAGTLTEGGTVNTDGALLESATTVLAATDFDRVTVQVVLALEARAGGGTLQGGESEREQSVRACTDLEEPFRVAVTVADWSERLRRCWR